MMAYLFPGQGSQVRGMGETLFDEFPEEMAAADKILGYSIKKLCLEDENHQLFETNYSQPALYVVNALSFFKKIKHTDKKPDYVIGHSLGEYNALLAADVFDFATGLNIVKKRGELMSTVQGGAMAAIIGLAVEKIQEIIQQKHLENIFIANYNSYTQLVISGSKSKIDVARSCFEEMKGTHFIPLKVSGAFHTPFMNSIQEKFADFLNQFKFNTPTMPVISNLNVQPYHPLVTKTNLANHINHPVKWLNSIQYLMQFETMQFEEVGPGRVLTGLINRIKNKQ